MIITQTPFRLNLGGGLTDLPAYYGKHGGLVFSAAIDKYMFISVNHPIVDDLVRLKYSKSECVGSVRELQHDLAKAVLNFTGIENAIEILSMADIPAATGLGSSGAYAVGLLHAIFGLKRTIPNQSQLAEISCQLETSLEKKPVAKQDHYVAALGGLLTLEIEQSGKVNPRKAHIPYDVLDELNRNTLVFYSGLPQSKGENLTQLDLLLEKEDQVIVDSLHRIKEVSFQIIEAVESGNLDQFGVLMDKQWRNELLLPLKNREKKVSDIYSLALAHGALGGSLSCFGVGGFFVFYTPDRHPQLRRAMSELGLRELRYRFDTQGSKLLVNLFDGRTYFS